MKNFKNFNSIKYLDEKYIKIDDGIYKIEDEIFVTSLSFEIEKELYGEENSSPENISQIPFEDFLDEFLVFINDFYEELNKKSENTCYIEFGSENLANIKNLKTIIGKSFYAIDNGNMSYNIVIK